MLSYPRRLLSGHFMCYFNRTYHVLTTALLVCIDRAAARGDNSDISPAQSFSGRKEGAPHAPFCI
jgi:hypothetical protein